ncbi:sperm microtubule associated protein 2-like [Saccoglossus kowalevskii]|uniref:Testicular haploid expressed gene protein-like n=1 Tax=Saccoglossus kowalevskii TaxID=10224 RepID=A0ABM0GVS8_SACKO|nr:PREDICTED: testicular haploid expressed gene protein-like [Saccoglossus kowalevskii]
MAAATQSNVKRIDVLARPKQLPPTFREDRRSVYWLDRHASNSCNSLTLTPRQQFLANSKHVDNGWQGDRPTPIWPVSRSAQKASASERVETLASPKQKHPDYKPERAVETRVSDSAKSAQASGRLQKLAEPKVYAELKIRASREWDYVEWDPEISSSAKNARCSERVEQLAEPKNAHLSYQPEKYVQWPVSENAMKALATLRLQQLARPKSRGKVDNYDPYKVTPSARSARATPRIAELANPIPRKIRTKKIVTGPAAT